MKVKVSIRGPLGFYPSPEEYKALTLRDALYKLQKKFDALPAECDGQQLVDWKGITINVER